MSWLMLWCYNLKFFKISKFNLASHPIKLVILHGITKRKNTIAIHFQSLTLLQHLKLAIYTKQQAKQRFYKHYLCQSHKMYLLTSHLIWGT